MRQTNLVTPSEKEEDGVEKRAKTVEEVIVQVLCVYHLGRRNFLDTWRRSVELLESEWKVK